MTPKFLGLTKTYPRLVIIMLFAAGLRLYGLDLQGLWVDEIASMNGADPDRTWGEVITYSVSDQPPAFFLILHGWLKLVPFNDFYGRLLSVLLGLAGIAFVFFLGKEVKDETTGLTAAFITSFSYLHLLLSQEVRFYTLVFVASALSCLFFIRAIRHSGFRDYLFYTASTVLLLYTHYFGVVVFATEAILFLLVLIFFRRDKKFITFSFASALIIMAAVSPWIPIFFSDAQMNDFWLPPPPFYFPLQFFYVYFKDVLACVVFGSALLAYGWRLLKERQVREVDMVLIGWVVLCFLIPMIYSIIQTPLIHVRYSIIALPQLIVMIALGFSEFRKRARVALLIAVICTSLISLVVIEDYYTKIRNEEWRAIVNSVIMGSREGDVVVSRKAWYCNYYFKVSHSPIRAMLPEQAIINPGQPSRVWWIDGFNDLADSDPFEGDLLRQGYTLLKKDSSLRARALLYKRE